MTDNPNKKNHYGIKIHLDPTMLLIPAGAAHLQRAGYLERQWP